MNNNFVEHEAAITREFWEEPFARTPKNVYNEAGEPTRPQREPGVTADNEVLKVKLSEIGWYHP